MLCASDTTLPSDDGVLCKAGGAEGSVELGLLTSMGGTSPLPDVLVTSTSILAQDPFEWCKTSPKRFDFNTKEGLSWTTDGTVLILGVM